MYIYIYNLICRTMNATVHDVVAHINHIRKVYKRKWYFIFFNKPFLEPRNVLKERLHQKTFKKFLNTLCLNLSVNLCVQLSL